MDKETGNDIPHRFSNVTRYLCAAGVFDAKFRKSVLDEVCHQQFRCRAPEFGIDPNSVIETCLRAARREKIRDWLLVTIFCLLTAVIFVQIQEDRAAGGRPAKDLAPFLYAVVAFGIGILFVSRMVEHEQLRTIKNRRLLPMSVPSYEQNVVVYAGYTPFVGSGLSIRNWSFVINLRRGPSHRTDALPIMFSEEDLYGFVRDRLDQARSLMSQSYFAIFINGKSIRRFRNLLVDEFDTETLITYVDMKNPASAWNEIRSSIPDHSESRPNYSKLSRIYLVLTLYDGDGQIVLNVYIRFKHQNHSLFVEANYYPLPPVKAQYLRLDENDFETNAQTMFFFAFSSLFTLPFSLAAAPWNLLRASHAKHRMRMRDSHFWDMIQKNLALDFGGHISIRQLGAGTHYGSYFERMDKEMNLKTIEQCLIDAIVDFLESHNVDTSDIRDRRAAILNQGIIVSGGGFQAGSVAVGSGATTVTHGANDVRASGDHAA